MKIVLKNICCIIGCTIGVALASGALYIVHGIFSLFFFILSLCSGGIAGFIIGAYLDFHLNEIKKKFKTE